MEDRLKEKDKFGQVFAEAEFLGFFTYQELFDAYQQGGLENWSPSTFIGIVPKETKFVDTLDVVESFSSFYSNWMMTARNHMKQIPYPVISEMIVNKIISVFPEDLRKTLHAKREALKRSEDKDVKLSADNPDTYIKWVNELQIHIQAPNSDADKIFKVSLKQIRALREQNKALKGQKEKS